MIKTAAVGKIEEEALRTQIEEYEKRLRPSTKLEIIEVSDEMAPQSNNDSQNNQAKEKEGKHIFAKIKEQECVTLLDLWGEMIDSEWFSKKPDQPQTYQISNFTFVITDSLRPDKDVYDRRNWRWKLNDLTFTHQMTKVLVLEQIYRALTVQNNNPYHK